MSLRLPPPLRLPVVEHFTASWPELEEDIAALRDDLVDKGYDKARAARLARQLVSHTGLNFYGGFAGRRDRAVAARSHLETFFVTFADDRRDCWVRIEAPTRDDARAFMIKKYGGRGWDELVNDVVFNPDLYGGGEMAAFRVHPQRLDGEAS